MYARDDSSSNPRGRGFEQTFTHRDPSGGTASLLAKRAGLLNPPQPGIPVCETHHVLADSVASDSSPEGELPQRLRGERPTPALPLLRGKGRGQHNGSRYRPVSPCGFARLLRHRVCSPRRACLSDELAVCPAYRLAWADTFRALAHGNPSRARTAPQARDGRNPYAGTGRSDFAPGSPSDPESTAHENSRARTHCTRVLNRGLRARPNLPSRVRATPDPNPQL